ncbi:MAG: uroporphyrinogen decarboxylase family protein [Caldilineaceae bacterium]
MSTLSSRERVLRAIRRQPTDCVAAMPYMYDIAAHTAGISVLDFCTDPEKMVQAQLTLHDQVGQDVIAIGADNYYIAEGFGGVTTRNEDEIPALIGPPLTDMNGIFDIEIPDPQRDGRMPVMIEALKLARKAVGNDVALRSPGTGPFALASYFIGSQQWLLEIAMIEHNMEGANEPAVLHALELATEALIRFGKACHDAGADILHCGDSLASCNVISPKTYERFSWPYSKRVFEAWHAHGARNCLLHICGDSTRVLDLYADTGADMVEIDNAVSMATAKQRIGDRTAIVGNVHTVVELLEGTPDMVRASAQRCIDEAGQGGGFLLGSGCIVPRYAPLENVKAMIEVAHSQPYPED